MSDAGRVLSTIVAVVVIAGCGGGGTKARPDAGLEASTGLGGSGGGAPADDGSPGSRDAAPDGEAPDGAPVDLPVMDDARADARRDGSDGRDTAPDLAPPDTAPPPCAQGTTRCDAATKTAEVCTAGLWMKKETCPYLCVAGACSGECTPGDRQCQGLTPRSCDQNGMWTSAPTPCLSVCTNGICSGTCTPTDKQCGMNQTPQTCDGTGTWVDGTACQYVCSGKGVCGGDCAPGSHRCDGTTGQVCDGTGHYAPSGADCTPPTILSTSPASNADGVRADAWVVIVFSEPMDAASTELAFSSPDLPAHTFSWDASGQVLTVTPGVALQYASGADRSVPPRRYSFTVGTGAADRAGNKLAVATTVTFSTLRRFVFSVGADDTTSGYVGDNGDVGIGDGFVYANCAGMTYPSEVRAFLSFDIAGMPDDVEAVDAADLTLTAIMLEPSQVFPSAPLEVAPVQFSALTETTFDVAAGASLGALTRGAGNLWSLSSAALRDAAATAYGSRGTNNARAQYRIRVGAATCEERASFDLHKSAPADLPKLSVAYLVR